jgi:hypothetical protein
MKSLIREKVDKYLTRAEKLKTDITRAEELKAKESSSGSAGGKK